MKDIRGYTLVEVMVVILIVGIIVSAASAKYMNSFDKAAEQEAIAKLNTIIAAEEIYHTNLGSYYVTTGTINSTTTAAINAALGMQLATDTSRHWDYGVFEKDGSVPPVACATAVRIRNNVASDLCWKLCTDTPAPAKTCD